MAVCCFSKGYNTMDGMPNIGYRIIEYLMLNNEDIWKLLKYPSYDALDKPNLTIKEKRELIYDGASDAENFGVFRGAYYDDAFDEQTTQLRVFVQTVNPISDYMSHVEIAIECLCHNKIVHLKDYLNRLEVMVQQVIATLNGVQVGGIGTLRFSQELDSYNQAILRLYNNRAVYGFRIIMTTMIGSDDNGEC